MGLFRKDKPTPTLFETAENQADKAYHELLKRADDPLPDDPARLEEMLPFLGITLRDAKGDFAVLKRAAELQAVIDKAEKADAEMKQIQPQLDKLEKQLLDYRASIEPKINTLKGEMMLAERDSYKQHEARGELNDLRTRFPRAFGIRRDKHEATE